MVENNSSIVLANATYYTKEGFRKGSIAIREDKIEDIYDDIKLYDIPKDCQVIDCSNLTVVPGFIDSHLHLPGDYLYRYFGVNLSDQYSILGYMEKIQEVMTQEVKIGEHNIIRGYGWNHDIMEEDGLEGYKKIKSLVDELYQDKFLILYSDDYHSCICNERLLSRYKTVRDYDYSLNEVGLLEEEDIFEIQKQIPEICFSNDEIKEAIIKYQEMLLSKGITSVQTLMFLGGDNHREWRILKELEEEKQLFINVNLALTIHPKDTKEYLFSNLERLSSFAGDRIRINTIKIYIDGVVENRTAYLSEPYENSKIIGNSLWEKDSLIELCRFVDKNNLQLHAHAIGDLAVNLITDALCKAMDYNNSKRRNRHVITHLQIVNDEDIKRMGEYGIIANIQPYWIPIGDYYYPIDVRNLGKARAKDEYKVNSFFRHKVVVTASSDSPVTQDPYPILGISNAIFRSNVGERSNWGDMLKAFTFNGAYQLGREMEIGLIKKGYHADLTLLSNPLITHNRSELEKTKVMMTICRGRTKYLA